MASVAFPDREAGEDLGVLANNYMQVLGLQSSLSRSSLNAETVPDAIAAVIEDGAWRAFRLPDGRVVRNPADFRRFIEGPRPEGCQTPLHVLRRMVQGTEVEQEVERLLRGTPGAPEGSSNNPLGRAARQDQELIRHHMTDKFPDADPDTIPFDSAPPKPPRVRDYSRESKQGTSVGYTLRRLEKVAPELLESVKAGELSPNAAAIKAGFRDRAITVPATPRKAARVLLRHFHGEALAELIAGLADGVEF